MYVRYIESEARGHAQWRWLLPSCGYGGLSCLAMRYNNYKWSDVNFSWQYLLFTLAQLYFRNPPLTLFPLPLSHCPLQLYRAVLSLNKWNLLLTVSDPNYTYRLFISIYTHTCRVRSSRSQHGKATLCSMYLLSSLDSQRNATDWLIDPLSVPLSAPLSVPQSVWLLSFKRFNCAKRRLQSEDAAQPQIMYLCIWS